MVEVGVVLEQTLQHVVGLLVVDHVGQARHDLLDQRVDHVDRECLHAHVQHAAALHVLRQCDRVFVDHFQQGRILTLDLERIRGLAELGTFEFFESWLEPFLH